MSVEVEQALSEATHLKAAVDNGSRRAMVVCNGVSTLPSKFVQLSLRVHCRPHRLSRLSAMAAHELDYRIFPAPLLVVHQHISDHLTDDSV